MKTYSFRNHAPKHPRNETGHLRTISSALAIATLILPFISLQGYAAGARYPGPSAVVKARSGFDQPNVVIEKLDFVPLDRSDYKLRWTGNQISYASCYHFEPIIELAEPAPQTFTRDYDIVKDRWWFLADEMIGGFSVTFNEGSTVPDRIEYVNSLNDSSQIPSGTPDSVLGRFWMGCTQKRKIKANADKDGRSGNLYITRSPVMIPADGITLGGKGSSPKHRVSCEVISEGSGEPRRNKCAPNQKCCGGPMPDGTCQGQCWPAENPCP